MHVYKVETRILTKEEMEARAPASRPTEAPKTAQEAFSMLGCKAIQLNRPTPVPISQTIMRFRWTRRAYRMNYDGTALVTHDADGVTVHKNGKKAKVPLDLSAHNPREWIWHPNNKMVAFWAPVTQKHNYKRIAVKTVTDESVSRGDRSYRILYKPPENHHPFGYEWSPWGDCLFVIERVYEDGIGFTVVQRVDAKTGRGKEILRMLGEIDWFMAPVSRYENGNGPSKAPYNIIFGATEGLFLTDPWARERHKLSQLPAVGLDNFEWNPKEGVEQCIMLFSKPVAADDGDQLEGLYMLDVKKALAGEGEAALSPIMPKPDIHTVWYSPKGTYVVWAGRDAVYYRKAHPNATNIKISPPSKQLAGEVVEIKGTIFSHDEKKLAYTAGPYLFVHDIESGHSELVAAFTGKGFLAEPHWRNNDKEIVVAFYEDIKDELSLRRSQPIFNMPLERVGTQGRVVPPSGGGNNGGRPR